MLGFRCKLAVLPHKEIVQRGLFVFFFLLPSVGNLGNKDASDSWWYSECSPRRGGDEIIPRHLFWQ